MRFVLDNSVAMCWLLSDGKATDVAYAEKVLGSLTGMQAVVPSLWALEVANVLAKCEAKGVVTEARSQAFIALLNRLTIVEDSATRTHALEATLHLARRYKISSYDAAYLELALRTGSPLATLDVDLKKAAKSAGVPMFSPN
jgi:predicted nucleic acid-binding protein